MMENKDLLLILGGLAVVGLIAGASGSEPTKKSTSGCSSCDN